MVECLTGLIGLSPAQGEVESNLYLTELSGITLVNIQKIAEQQPEQPDFEAVFHDCEKRAVISFAAAFAARIGECYHICHRDMITCLICSNVDILAPALWYAIGAETMIERQGSDRLNRFTTIDKKKAADLQSFFEERYAYVLDNAVKSINPNLTGCVETGETVEHRRLISVEEVLP